MVASTSASPKRRALLSGVSFLGIVASWAAPHPAFATCVVLTPVAGPVVVSTNCTITPTGVISGASTGINSSGNYGTLSNSGSVRGNDNGIENTATLGTLTNAGSVAGVFFGAGLNNQANIGMVNNLAGASFTGAYYGIFNTGGITTLSNIGAISSQSAFGGHTMAALFNAGGGGIGSLSNSGTIRSAETTALNNGGSITVLGNSGSILGYYDGVHNGGEISTLVNGGTINASADTGIGLDNSGTLGNFSNGGSITGQLAGLSNTGSIGSFTNNTGGDVAGGPTGLANTSLGTIMLLLNSGTLTGTSFGIKNNGGITGFTNTGSGIVSSGDTAFDSSGQIGTLVNAGSIIGDQGGITNSGTISGLTNSGTVAATSIGFGVINDPGGAIGTIDNMAGGSFTGFYVGLANKGSLIALSNNGTISGNYTGLSNTAGIGTVTNTGTLIGTQSSGVFNSGTITALSNSGQIGGAQAGLQNAQGGVLTQFDNAGTITASQSGNGTLDEDGVENSGAITTLMNSGVLTATASLVSGSGTLLAVGLLNAGTISTLANSGGIDAVATLVAGGGTLSAIGLQNSGTIGNFANSGTIAALRSSSSSGDLLGGQADAVLNSGVIDHFDNQAGGLIGTGTDAIVNSGTMLTLSNEGIIADALQNNTNNTLAAGILNTGTLDSIFNTGSMTGVALNDFGTVSLLDNQAAGFIQYIELQASGTLTSLQNSGTISSIFNLGSIDVLSNFASGTMGAGNEVAILNAGVLHSLANTGTMAGSGGGVENVPSASIDLLLNNGEISGGQYGVINIGTIGLLQNNALIAGPANAALFNAGVITSIANAGSILGTSGYALGNEGTIGSIDNQSVITGKTGIFNDGPITALTNGGVISGSFAGVENTGSIATVLNSGTLSGGTFGLQNASAAGIGSIVNSGLITGGTIGIANSGAIGGILNTGTISGIVGLDLSAGSATLVNSGTIIGTGGTAILIGGNDDLIFTTGSGLQGMINGLNSTNAIQLQGQGALDTDIVNFASGSALKITPGADWSAEGSWALDQVTNDGVFQPGMQNGGIGTPLTITGNFAQGSDGVLEFAITPEQNSALQISGNASLDGELVYDFAPGIYTSRTYTVLTSGTLSGQFASISNGARSISGALTISTVYLTDPGVDLVISEAAGIPGGGISGGGAPVIVPVPDAAIYSAQRQALALDAIADTSLLLDQAIAALQGSPRNCAAAAKPQRDAAIGGRTAQLAAELANGFCAAGGWIAATGDLFNASAGGAAGYNANTAGFLAGIDKPVGINGPRLGFAIGYDHTSLNERGGGSAGTGVVRVALYGAQQIDRLTLSGALDYGSAGGNVTRAAGIADFRSDDSANIFGGGIQAGSSIDLGRITLTPAAGLRFASVSGGHFSEGASAALAAFAVHGDGPGYVSTQPYATLQLERILHTQSGLDLGTHLGVGYQYEAGDNGVQTDALTRNNGTILASDRNHLARSAAVLGAGLSGGRNDWSLFLNYAGHVASNWNDQTGEFGLRIIF